MNKEEEEKGNFSFDKEVEEKEMLEKGIRKKMKLHVFFVLVEKKH